MATARIDIKIVLLGKEYGGKTSLVERFLHGRFAESIAYQNTIGAAFGAKKLMVGDEAVTLGVWDTAGSERYQAMSRMYYRGAVAAVVCVNLTEADSFQRAKYWVDELRSCEGDACRLYLVGTKCDLVNNDRSQRNVDSSTMQAYAEETGSCLMETSAKTGHNVDKLFDKIARDCCPRSTRGGRSKSIALHDSQASSGESQASSGGRCCIGSLSSKS